MSITPEHKLIGPVQPKWNGVVMDLWNARCTCGKFSVVLAKTKTEARKVIERHISTESKKE